MERTYVSTTPVDELEQIVTREALGAFDFKVWTGDTGSCEYRQLEIVHRCCNVARDAAGVITKIRIVAGGGDRPGPFLFIWTPEGFDPNRPACNGMPLDQVSVSQ
jgi:hypothetical protein